MTALYDAALAAEIGAALTGIALARRSTAHRPAAVALVLLSAIAESRAGTVAALHDLPRPVVGAARMLVYLDGALFFGATAVVAGLAVTVSSASPEERARSWRIVVAVWALASVALAVAYPSPMVRGVELHRIYLLVDIVGMCVSMMALSRLAVRRERADSAQAVAIALTALAFGCLLVPYGPWRESIFLSPYNPIQIGILIFFAAFTVAQVVLWRRYSR